MDPWWILNVLRRPRDQRTGQLILQAAATPGKTERERFFDYYRDNWLPEWEIESLWRLQESRKRAAAEAAKAQQK